MVQVVFRYVRWPRGGYKLFSNFLGPFGGLLGRISGLLERIFDHFWYPDAF